METGKAENTSNVFYMALSCMDNYGITSTILYLSVVLFHCVPRSVADKFHTSAENLLIILLLARPEPHPHSLSALKYFSSTFPVDTHDNTLLHAALIASYRADRKWRLGAIPIVAKLVRKWSRVGLLREAESQRALGLVTVLVEVHRILGPRHYLAKPSPVDNDCENYWRFGMFTLFANIYFSFFL